MFFWNPHDPTDVGNLISGFSAFSKTSLNICKFTVHILLKPDLENFEHYFTSLWDECNCVVVWAFFGIAFLWDSVQFSRWVVSDPATPWIAARQASLSITNSWSSLRLMSIELVMPSSQLILWWPLLLPSIFPSIKDFSNESAVHIRWPKYWSRLPFPSPMHESEN